MSFLSKFKKKEQPQPNCKRTWLQSLFADFDVIYIFVAFMLIYILLFRTVVVDGSSMNATLVDGDSVLLLSNTFYHNPQQGDIIVASKDSFRDGECIVKRVIATEGQVVDIDFENRIVYVDGKPLEESYAFFKTTDTGPMVQQGITFPLRVDDGCIFVMGDNRNESMDSRHPEIGLIDKREILGKALFLIWPGTDYGRTPADYSRIGGFN